MSEEAEDSVGFLEVTAGWQTPPWEPALAFLQSLPSSVLIQNKMVAQKQVASSGRPSQIQPYDLEMALRDGTVLCRAVAALSDVCCVLIKK